MKTRTDQGYMKVREVAKHLGLSEKRVYQLVHAGALTHGIVGGRINIPRSAVIAYGEKCIRRVGSIA